MNVALRPEHLDIISICTGGGGLDLGVELAIPCARSVCMVEREAFAVAQLVAAMEARHLAPAPVWSDARTFDGKPWRGLVDGLIGGIPCQPHSLAGRKRGQHDPRDLWSDARRIIATARPWFVLIENVEGMLSAGDDEVAGAERVWRDLRKLGFAVEGGLFTAAEVGASHQRERIFILGVADANGADEPQEREGHAAIRGRRREQPAGARATSGGAEQRLSGVGQADPYGERLEGLGSDAGARGRQDARGPAGLRDRAIVVDPSLIGRGEGRTEPELRSGRDSAAGADSAVAHAQGIDRRLHEGRGAEGSRTPDAGGAVEAMADTNLAELRRESPAGQLAVDEHYARLGLFPPGPADVSGWRLALDRSPELEPAFRRVADGLASRLDIARVGRLRLLGNGVVPLQAAYALRTLVARLAGRGSAGADQLIRMMEA